MKNLFLLILSLFSISSFAQHKTQNVIVITTDGFRWQEVFKGMDTEIANNKRFNGGDSTYIYKTYWAEDPVGRRRKLLPFFWSTLSDKGQIFGNRSFGNNVDVSNPYWFSYPGYSEMFCGYADEKVNSNNYKDNPNTNVFEFINKQQSYMGKVAAFSAWDALNRILNEDRSGFPVVAAFDASGAGKPAASEKLINALLKDSYKPWKESECLDVFTHYAALENLKIRKPRVQYISYGETDEWAHAGNYKNYLDAAHQFDQWLQDIWNYIQNDPQYKDKTTLFITTDHGRGDKNKNQWTSHGSSIPGAGEIWFAAIGPDTEAKGEIKTNGQFYQKQFAQSIASFLGLTFVAEHPVEERIKDVKK